MKKLFLAAAAAAIIPAAAMAQDAGIGGAYVGGQLGWGKRSSDFDLGSSSGTRFKDDRSGVDYGAFIGYDAPVGTNFLVGVEAGIGAGGKTLRGAPEAGVTASIDPKWNWDVSARAGFLASPNLLIYGRAGYGGERIETTVNSTVAGVTPVSDKSWSSGIIYGGGVEYGLNEAASVRAEYRHRDMEKGYSADQALAGLAFRF